ncbi:MAG: hypothetical protein JEZ09_17705 [Salinivirgaceae bacterium]|nr:hypothetical protein [Salinivirgaceae bacterium]
MNKSQKLVSVLILFISFFFCDQVLAQMHVFTKELSRKYESDNKDIVINGEKAIITISPSTNSMLIVELQIISKDTDKEKAKQQLSFLHYVEKDSKKEIYLRDYILIPVDEELTGTIEAIYTVKIPSNKNVRITNSLGKVIISNCRGNYKIDMKYGNITISNLKGNLDLTNHIGEVIINHCDMIGVFNTKYTSNYFNNNKGKYTFETNLGSINFELSEDVTWLSTESEGTEITLSNKNCIEYNMVLQAKAGKIFLNDCVTRGQKFITENNLQTVTPSSDFEYFKEGLGKIIIIKNKYANISVH